MSKRHGVSFAADYYPELHFASVCVNYNSSTKVRIKSGTSRPIIFLTAMEAFFNYVSPIRI